MTIGSMIKQRRKDAGLTQNELAQKVGCATITIRQYESGKREPNISALYDIANALGVEIFDLIPDEPCQDPFSGLSEEEKEYVIKVSGGDETALAILLIFLHLPDDKKFLFLKEVKRISRDTKEENYAVDPQEKD